MDDTPILNAPWPDDLDPATVPFLTRNVTILRRLGFFGDWSLFNTLTEDQVLSWRTAGVWMPQVGEAERDGWPGEYTEAGVAATRRFLGGIASG